MMNMTLLSSTDPSKVFTTAIADALSSSSPKAVFCDIMVLLVSGDALVAATEQAAPYDLGLGFKCLPTSVPGSQPQH
jgi:hypothetical protein